MTTTQQNLVGPAVRRLRMDAGMSQAAMIAKLQLAGWGISRAGLSKIEARLRRVTDAELYLLAKILNCGIRDLYPARVTGIKDVLRHGRD